MNKRLKYDKYRGMDNIITIDLHNGYTTIAIIEKDENEELYAGNDNYVSLNLYND